MTEVVLETCGCDKGSDRDSGCWWRANVTLRRRRRDGRFVAVAEWQHRHRDFDAYNIDRTMRGVGDDPDEAVAAMIADAEAEAEAEAESGLGGVQVACVRRAAREAAIEMDRLLDEAVEGAEPEGADA